VSAGSAVPIDREYIFRILDVLEIGGLLIALDAWAKLIPKNIQQCLAMLETSLAAAIARAKMGCRGRSGEVGLAA